MITIAQLQLTPRPQLNRLARFLGLNVNGLDLRTAAWLVHRRLK